MHDDHSKKFYTSALSRINLTHDALCWADSLVKFESHTALGGGTLLASLMATMPAWRAIDPLPIVDGMSDHDEEDTETLEPMVEDNTEDQKPDVIQSRHENKRDRPLRFYKQFYQPTPLNFTRRAFW